MGGIESALTGKSEIHSYEDLINSLKYKGKSSYEKFKQTVDAFTAWEVRKARSEGIFQEKHTLSKFLPLQVLNQVVEYWRLLTEIVTDRVRTEEARSD